MVHRTILVSGKVQGVGYRQAATQKARALGVLGYVKNLPDGRVQAEVEGPVAAVEAFVTWCNQGPALSRVSGLEVSETEIKNYTDFRIEY